MPSKEEKEINEVYKNAKICSWKYRKVDLALTNTVKSQGKSGLRAIPDKKFKPIFRKQVADGEQLVMDPKRKQCLDLISHVKGTWIQKTLEHLQEELNMIYPDLVICYVSALKSMPGGEMQSFNADFATFNFVRFAGLISFDSKTKLEIRISPRQEVTIDLQEGEAIIFRGDLFHAGSSYEEENRRIYFKALPRGCVLGDHEYDAVALGYVCDRKKGGCGERFNFKKELSNHCHKCDVWKEGKKKEEVDKFII